VVIPLLKLPLKGHSKNEVVQVLENRWNPKLKNISTQIGNGQEYWKRQILSLSI
jgi:hypothetical protein